MLMQSDGVKNNITSLHVPSILTEISDIIVIRCILCDAAAFFCFLRSFIDCVSGNSVNGSGHAFIHGHSVLNILKYRKPIFPKQGRFIVTVFV